MENCLKEDGEVLEAPAVALREIARGARRAIRDGNRRVLEAVRTLRFMADISRSIDKISRGFTLQSQIWKRFIKLLSS